MEEFGCDIDDLSCLGSVATATDDDSAVTATDDSEDDPATGIDGADTDGAVFVQPPGIIAFATAALAGLLAAVGFAA